MLWKLMAVVPSPAPRSHWTSHGVIEAGGGGGEGCSSKKTSNKQRKQSMNITGSTLIQTSIPYFSTDSPVQEHLIMA